MFSSNQFIGRRMSFQGVVSALIIIVLTLFPILALAEEDPCREMGIYIGNQTGLDVWYTRNGGSCTIWNRGHNLIIRQEDTLIVYRDMTCETVYCSENPTYDVYKSFDDNRNCRVKILPGCTLSDM